MYNGHKNYNHWNVSLWINNDEELYTMARTLSRRMNRDAAARAMLKALPSETPDGAPYTFTTVRAAMRDM